MDPCHCEDHEPNAEDEENRDNLVVSQAETIEDREAKGTGTGDRP